MPTYNEYQIDENTTTSFRVEGSIEADRFCAPQVFTRCTLENSSSSLRSRGRQFFRLIMLALWLVACAPTFTPTAQPPVSTLRVVMDNHYPPYVFEDENGLLRGILIDQWRLWEVKTGVKVEITALPWLQALERMKTGDFDVIDTIFYTEAWLRGNNNPHRSGRPLSRFYVAGSRHSV